MVDLVQDILELLRMAPAFSEMNPERNAIDRAQRKRWGRAAIDLDRGRLLLGRVLRSGNSIQGEQRKNCHRQKRTFFQDCPKPIPMLIAPR
jgi:hypothetical protein